jgi:triacylglycerol esterase/lipase EstA (alpha/beta hydrolase family)
MQRRFTLSLLSALILAVPATAAAQTPVDDATAARLFTDAALRAQPQIAAASQQLEALGDPVECEVDVPRKRRARVTELRNSLHVAHTIAGFTRTVEPVLTRASHDLHGVATTDTALKSGRTGWRRLRRTYAGFAALPAADVCAQVRAYVRNGFRHTTATRRAIRAFHAMMAWDTRDVDRRMAGAVSRLVELGIAAAEADAFDGELGE